MSAFPPKADTKAHGPRVRFGPRTESCTATRSTRPKQKDRREAVSPKSDHIQNYPPDCAALTGIGLVPSVAVGDFSLSDLKAQRTRGDYQIDTSVYRSNRR